MDMGCENCSSRTKGCFSAIGPKAILEVNENKTLHKHKKGKVIFSEGNPSTGIYCIRHGKIKLSKTNQSGKESIIQLISAGNLIGHHNFFAGSTYYASAIVMEDAEVCRLPTEFIMEAISNHPTLAIQIIKQLSHAMSETEIKLNSLLQRNVRERLAQLLLTLSYTYGVKDEERLRLDIKLSRDEIAALIGTVNETVTRFITEFKTEGLIEEEGKNIYVIDHDRLKDFANLDG